MAICNVCGAELVFAGADEELDEVYWACPNASDSEHRQWQKPVDLPYFIVSYVYDQGIGCRRVQATDEAHAKHQVLQSIVGDAFYRNFTIENVKQEEEDL